MHLEQSDAFSSLIIVFFCMVLQTWKCKQAQRCTSDTRKCTCAARGVHSLFAIGMEEQVSLFVWADILWAFSFLYMCVCVPVCTCVKQWKRDVIQSWQVKAVKHWGHTWRERRCLTGWKCHSEEERMFRRWGMRREMQSGSRQRCNRPICLWCNGEKMVWHGW